MSGTTASEPLVGTTLALQRARIRGGVDVLLVDGDRQATAQAAVHTG